MNRPSIGQWLKEMSSCLIMEKITYVVKGKQDTFREVWGPFLDFIEQSNIGEILGNEGNTG